MNNDSYEQLALGDDIVGDKYLWMKENTNASLMFYKGKCIILEVPMFVELVVTQSDPGIQGDRSSAATKPATLETGAVIQVPLFINEGDKLKIDTRTREYITRV